MAAIDWTDIGGSVVTGVTDMVTGAGDIIAILVPVGIGLMLVMAVPRIIRRVVNAFI